MKNMPDSKNIIARLEKLMAEKKLSQRELGELLGVTDRAVRHWLSGERNVSKTALMLLERIEKEQASQEDNKKQKTA